MHIKSRFLLFPAFEKRDLDLRGMKEVLNSFCILSKRPILCAKNHSGCWGWKMLKVNKSHSFCLMITKLYPHFKVYNSMYYQKKRKDLRITTMIHFCASFQQKLKKIQKTFKINKKSSKNNVGHWKSYFFSASVATKSIILKCYHRIRLRFGRLIISNPWSKGQ